MCNSMIDRTQLSSLAHFEPRINSYNCSKIFNEPHEFILEMINHIHDDYPEQFTKQHFYCHALRNNKYYQTYYTLTLEGFYFLCRYSLSNIAKKCTALHFEAMDGLSIHLESLLDGYTLKQ